MLSRGSTSGRFVLSLACLLLLIACDEKSAVGPSCVYVVSPRSLSFAPQGGSGTIDISTASDCSWSASTTAEWIVLSGNVSGSGSGRLAFTATENRTTSQRTGTVAVAQQTVTITQSAATPGPPSASLAVTVDSFGSMMAVKGLSNVTLDASGSTGDGLTFLIDFGDGYRATTAVAKHVYSTAGDMTARVVVTDALGRTSSAEQAVRIDSIESRYYNYMWNPNAGRYESRSLEITNQAGLRLNGTYRHPEGNYTPFEGTLSGERDVTLTLTDGTITFTGAKPQGGIGTDCRTMTLLVRGGSADGMSLVFTR